MHANTAVNNFVFIIFEIIFSNSLKASSTLFIRTFPREKYRSGGAIRIVYGNGNRNPPKEIVKVIKYFPIPNIQTHTLVAPRENAYPKNPTERKTRTAGYANLHGQ